MVKELFSRAGVLSLTLAGLLANPLMGAPTSNSQTAIGGVQVGEVLARLGAEMEAAVTAEQLAEYSHHFDRIDLDGDGSHSAHEFVEKGTYMTAQARRGIFGAADRDQDGSVSKPEYLLNRIITDEGKAIMGAMDKDGDGAVQANEFSDGALGRLGDKMLCDQVFRALDGDEDGEVRIPEYLRVWGLWARSGQPSAAQRIKAREGELKHAAEAGRAPGTDSKPAEPESDTQTRPQSGRPSVDRIFERFDTDGDGKLGQGEMPERAARFIQPADADKDGFVTKAELLEHRKRSGR